MNVDIQIALGNIGNILASLWWALAITAPIPLFIWFIVSLCLWFYKKKKSLNWWGLIVGICCLYGLVVLGYLKVFNPAPYVMANRINVYIPMTVQVLEDDQVTAMDGQTEYEVIRFSPSQMDTFIKSIEGKGWKYGAFIPNTLRHPNPNDYPDAMSERKYPLPNGKRYGYYYSFFKKTVGNGDWHTTRKAYFLDVNTRALYIYYDDSQWG